MFKDGDISGVLIKKLTQHNDSRGWLAELYRIDELDGYAPVMSYISVTRPDVMRGPHEHIEQTDYFCFFGKFVLHIWDNRKNSPTYGNKMTIEDANGLVVLVPPGVVHAYKNAGDADGMVINLPDRLFSGWGKKDKIDEVRYENDPESPFKVE